MFNSENKIKSPIIATAIIISIIWASYIMPAKAAGSGDNTAGKQTKIEKRAKKILKTMTLKQRVGQLLFIGPAKDDITLMKKNQYGGYIFFASDLNNTRDSFRERIHMIQQAAKINAFIGADEEGGSIAPISGYAEFRNAPFPSPRELFKQGGYNNITSDTTAKCSFLKDLGFNTNFAPVADVPYSSGNYMWNRSFSSKHKSVSKYIKTVLDVMNKNKMTSVVKHFPGYGGNGNTHTKVIVDDRSLKTFKKRDLKPFVTGIKNGCSMIMVSHNIVKCFDKKKPASISKKVHKYIRSEMGYEGVIISDSMTMSGVKEFGKNQGELAVKAFNAGNDMICANGDKGSFEGLLAAARSGKVSKKRINASVLRILELKLKMNIIR